MKKILTTLLMLFFLSSCARLHFENKTGVVDNTFYSSRLPKLMVSVDESLLYQETFDGSQLGGNEDVQKKVYIEIKNYLFSNTWEGKHLLIKSERLKENRWYITQPDYSNLPYVYSSGHVVFRGKEFDTWVFAHERKTGVQLVKVYETTFSDALLFQIFYIESVGRDWLKKYKSLPGDKRTALERFEKRADKSFTVVEYDDSFVSAHGMVPIPTAE